MIKLGIIEGNIKLIENKSERFESRFSTVRVKKSNSIFLKNMEDTIFGIWLAHKEGQFVFDKETNTKLMNNNQIPIQYYHNDKATMLYPFNPNHSMNSSAAIISKDGRHLAMMPHPERSFLKWQIPWCPNNIKINKYTPWYYLFKNAYEWCYLD